MKLVIRSDKKEYSEVIDLDEQKEHFEECQNNGANPDLEKITFEEYTKPLKDKISNLHKYNGPHFIFGYMECLFQSDSCPNWVENKDEFEVVD